MYASKVVAGVDVATADQYNRLRADAKGASYLLVHAQNTPNNTYRIEAGYFYVGNTKVTVAEVTSTAVTAPTTSQRIDLISVTQAGAVVVTAGTEGGAVPNVPVNNFPIAEIYCKVGSSLVKDDSDGTNHYIVDRRATLNFTGNVLDLTAGENISAENLVYCLGSNVYKTKKSFSTPVQPNTTTGLATSTTERVIKAIKLQPGFSVAIYKKAADNKLYAEVTNRGTLTTTIGVEKLLASAAILEAADGFDACTFGSGGNKFVVVYKLASDDKVYGIACTVNTSTLIITAGTPTVLYTTNILASGTRPTCASSISSNTFLVGFHNGVTNNPIVVPCTSPLNVITPGTALVVEAVTMNVLGNVNIVSYITANNIGVFYDDGTNIKYNLVTSDGTTLGTPCSLGAGYITGSAKSLFLEDGKVMLFTYTSGYVRVQTVNTPLAPSNGDSFYVSANDRYISIGTTTASLFDVCSMGLYPYGSSGLPQIGLVNYGSTNGINGIRFRKFMINVDGLTQTQDILAIGTTPSGMSIVNHVVTYRDFAYLCYQDTTKLMQSQWVNTEDLYVGIAVASATAGNKVNIATKGQVILTGANGGNSYYVSDNGGFSESYGTRKIGVGVGADKVLLQ